MRKKGLLIIGLVLALLLLFLPQKPAPDCHAIPTGTPKPDACKINVVAPGFDI